MITVISGITPNGAPHIGNYIGALRPTIEVSRNRNIKTYCFIADLHALIKLKNPKKIKRYRLEMLAAWLAIGLDPKNVILYCQSAIPEITELMWLLCCICSKGLLNRAHAYKSLLITGKNNINMGLYSYPLLMAADILLFNANLVLVGKDQIQHIEITRDIALKFNSMYGKYWVLPKIKLDKRNKIINGLDGRKMSKSYGNTIPLFCTEKTLYKMIRKIKTNSTKASDPKDIKNCTLLKIFSAFANKEEIYCLKNRYKEGISWSEVKKIVFDYINESLRYPRDIYLRLLKDYTYIKKILKKGEYIARDKAKKRISELKNNII
ncbi:Tryptophan--tRNA ligase [Candidatus Portiera aleyrodidarum]|uniref:Tryptophan--tRNA ligase n=1 Tax=Candidatus Portiera aleyrodidarum TV TaxID=1297582 RepID=A0A8D4BU39_9GAMM|nr:tryptophan--tRNA ligase [Candidatus Portiera aleyrodidarum]AGI27078.1 tryptophanyl-tRNA synthetase [Candidatus Portiera aleyrodidarum TV]CEI59042.1 Tryptophan--tRNA ligase [Candidatus Portiera aleyrodidarum]